LQQQQQQPKLISNVSNGNLNKQTSLISQNFQKTRLKQNTIAAAQVLITAEKKKSNNAVINVTDQRGNLIEQHAALPTLNFQDQAMQQKIIPLK